MGSLEDLRKQSKNSNSGTGDTLEQLRGSSVPITPYSKPITEYSQREVSNKDVENFAEYGVDTRFNQQDPYEQLGNNQSSGEKVWNGTLRLLGTTLTKVGEGVGYLGGFADYGINGFDDISRMTDNTISSAFSNLEGSIKDGAPIFTPPSVKEGGLLGKMGSLSWWMDQGVDGASFLLSSVIPGMALSKIGLGAKLAGSLGYGLKVGQGLDLAAITTYGTITEAAFEAKGVQDSVRKSFEKDILEGKISAEEAEIKAAEAARNTFALNAAVLLGPNLIQSKMLFGSPSELSTLKKIFDPKTGKLLENAGNLTKKQIIKEVGKQAGLGFLREGFFEENAQLAIENYETALAKGENDTDAITGILGNMYKNLFTNEGEESIFLGGVFGLAGGGVGGYIQNKKEAEIIRKAVIDMKNHIGHYTDTLKSNIKEVYETNEDGYLKTDDEGKPIINEDKAAKLLAAQTQRSQIEALKSSALLSGNKDLYDHIKNNEFTAFAVPFLEHEGGLEILNKQIDSLENDYLEETKNNDSLINETNTNTGNIKNEYKQKAENLKIIVDSVKQKTSSWDFSSETKDKGLHDSWLSDYKRNLVMLSSQANHYRNKINEARNEYLKAISGDLNLGLNEEVLMQTEEEKERIKNLENKYNQYKKLFEQVNERYKTLSSKEEAKKDWEQAKTNQKAFEEKREATKEEEKVKEKEKEVSDKFSERLNEIDKEIEDLQEAQINGNLNIEQAKENDLKMMDLTSERERLVNPEAKTKYENDIYHINENELKEGSKALYGSKEVEIAKIDKNSGTAIIKDGNIFSDIPVTKLSKFTESKVVDNEQETVSKTMTENPSLDINSKEVSNMDTKLGNFITIEADYRNNEDLAKEMFVVMHKQFDSIVDYIEIGKVKKRIFKWKRDTNGLPILSNTTNVDFQYTNKPTSLKRGDAVEFKLVDLSESIKQNQAETIAKNIAKMKSDSNYKSDNNYGYGENEAIGIYSEDKLVGFVQLPHYTVDGNPEKNDQLIKAREALITTRNNILQKLKNNERVISTINEKGPGNYFAQIVKDKGVFTDKAGNVKTILNEIEIREEDKVGDKPIFVYHDGEKLQLPKIAETDTLKGKKYKDTVIQIQNDLMELENIGKEAGQVFMLVKAANNTWKPIPVYSNNVTDEVADKVIEILKVNAKETDDKKVISDLQPYIFASLNIHSKIRINYNPSLEGEPLMNITVNGNNYSLLELLGNDKRVEKLKEDLKRQKQNINTNDINTISGQERLKENKTLTTNVIQVNGEYFIQPYISFDPVITEEQVEEINNTAKIEEVKTEPNIIQTESDTDILNSLVQERGLDLNQEDDIAYKTKEISDKEVEERIKKCK